MLLPLLALAGLAAATETPGIHELSFFGGTVVSNNLGGAHPVPRATSVWRLALERCACGLPGTGPVLGDAHEIRFTDPAQAYGALHERPFVCITSRGIVASALTACSTP